MKLLNEFLTGPPDLTTEVDLSQFVSSLANPHYALVLGLVGLAWTKDGMELASDSGGLTNLPPVQWSLQESQMTALLLSTIWPKHLTSGQEKTTTEPLFLQELKLFNLWDTCLNTDGHLVFRTYLTLSANMVQSSSASTGTKACGSLMQKATCFPPDKS